MAKIEKPAALACIEDIVTLCGRRDGLRAGRSRGSRFRRKMWPGTQKETGSSLSSGRQAGPSSRRRCLEIDDPDSIADASGSVRRGKPRFMTVRTQSLPFLRKILHRGPISRRGSGDDGPHHQPHRRSQSSTGPSSMPFSPAAGRQYFPHAVAAGGGPMSRTKIGAAAICRPFTASGDDRTAPFARKASESAE